jgi:hypothetical protein
MIIIPFNFFSLNMHRVYRIHDSSRTYQKEKNLPVAQCAICRIDAKQGAKIVPIGTEHHVICHTCSEAFSLQDLELMHNMFTAFGGYFGMMRGYKSSTYHVISQLIEEYNLYGKVLKTTEIDVKVLHKALLYGITPRQLVQGVRLLNE